MNRKTVLGALACAVAGIGTPAVAAPPSDALGKCMVDHASEADRTTLIRWVFAIMAASPKVQSLATVSQAQRDELSRQSGQLLSRLITVDCRAEAVASIKLNGAKTLKDSAGVLGETAMEGLMGDPAVARSMLGLLAGLDLRGWGDVMIEAGLGLDGKPIEGH